QIGTDSDTLHLIVTPVNDEPVFTLPAGGFMVNEDETAANIAALGQMLATNLGPGPVPTADDEFGQTLTFTLTPQTAADATIAGNVFATGTLSSASAIGAISLTLSAGQIGQFTGLTTPFQIVLG